MDWTIYNNTTPWGLLSSEQQMAFKKHKTGGTRLRVGIDDNLDYTDWSCTNLKYFGIDRLKPYILKQKDIKLLKSFNQHAKYITRKR